MSHSLPSLFTPSLSRAPAFPLPVAPPEILSQIPPPPPLHTKAAARREVAPVELPEIVSRSPCPPLLHAAAAVKREWASQLPAISPMFTRVQAETAAVSRDQAFVSLRRKKVSFSPDPWD